MDNSTTTQLLISILQTGGLATFFVLALNGLRKQIKIQNDTLKTMQQRISETEKIRDLYKSMIDSLPDDIKKFKEITTSLKDETIKELQKANEGKNENLAIDKLVESFNKIENTLLNKIENIRDASNSTQLFPSYDYILQHSGWEHKDLQLNIDVNMNSNIIAEIKLNSIGQTFRIYFKIRTNSGKQFWLGFGNGENINFKSKNEFTREIKYNSKLIQVFENINYAFKVGFPEIDEGIEQITDVRLRGDDSNLEIITFSFGFLIK